MTYEEYKRKKKQQEKAPEALTPYQKYRAEKGVSAEPTNNNTAASMKSSPVLAPAEAATFQRAQNNFSPVAKMVDDANQATQQELTYRQKYAGMDQTRLREAKSKLTPDSKEYVWLNSYITETMRPEDYARELEETDRQLQQAQSQLHQIYGAGGADYFTPEEISQAQQLQDTIRTLTHQKWDLEQQSKYRYLSEAENYAELSKPATTERKSGYHYIDTLLNKADYHYDVINGLHSSKAREDAAEQGNFVLVGIDDWMQDNLGYLKPGEKANYNYLYNTQGEDSAEEYLAYLKNTLSSRAEQYTLAEWQKLAKQLPVQTSIASVPMSLWGGVGMLDALGQKVVQDVSGEYSGPINYSSAAMLPAKAASTIRGTVAQDLADEHGTIQLDEEKHPVLSRVLNGKSWGDVYQLGMSMVDSAAVAALNPVLGTAGTVLLGGNAATQTMLDAVANGASDEQALSMGILSGAFETIFEKFELDHLLGADTNIVKAIINQALSEAVGEGATSISNAVADALVLGENSNWQKNIDRYMQENPGMTEAEARKQAFIDAAIQVGWDAVGGLFSGGIMGGGSSVVQNVSSRTQQPQSATQSGVDPQAENGQVTQETAAEPAPGSLEWMQELNELGAGNPIEGKTNAVSKPLSSYPAEKQSIIRSYLRSVDEKLKSFVQSVKSGDLSFKRQKISNVSERAASDIKDLLGIDVSGYTNNINTNGVQHIIDRHGENGEHDSTMAIDDDIARIGWVLENYDTVEMLTEKGKQVYSSEFRDNNNRPAPQIRFIKKIDGTHYVVEAACENKYKKLWVQGTYLQKNEDVTQASAESQKTNHETNAQSDLASPSSNKSIYQTPPVVNSDSSQSTSPESVGAAPGNPSVGAAEQNFTGRAAYQDLLTDENSQRDRPGDVRPVEVPKVDGYGRNVSEFVGNAYGSEVVPDNFTAIIEELVQEGALGYDTKTNSESLHEAAEIIKKKGMASARNAITKNIANGKIGDADIATAMLLFNQYAHKNGQQAQDSAAELFVDLQMMATQTGRNLQLFKMLRKMTPQGQLMAVSKNVDRYVQNINKRRGKKNRVEVSIPTELTDAYVEAAQDAAVNDTQENQQRKLDAEQAIYEYAASNIPATLQEKWDAWRYMAMLGNPKTQIRNILGNGLFRPFVEAKRYVGAAMESVFLEQDQRTKAVLGFSEADRALQNWAKQDSRTADTMKRMEYTATTGDAAASEIGDKRTIFKPKALEKARTGLNDLMSTEDMWFKRGAYSRALASFLKARGVTAQQLQEGSVDDAIINAARDYAVKEAMKATFNDQNAVSNFVANKLRYNGSNAFGKILNAAAEGILPFRRTPANIALRGLEYSPLGLGKTLLVDTGKLRSGEISGAEYIDSLAAGLTGSAAMAIGYALAAGIFEGIKLVGNEDDEDEKRTGHKSYALEIGDLSIPIDWAAPSALPLFMGANLYDSLNPDGENVGASVFTTFLDACANTLEPMLELSCLSSLNDLITDARYAEEGRELYALAASAATSYFMQGLPTLGGQIEQAFETEKKSVHADSADPVINEVQQIIGRATQKIPGIDLFQAEKVDAWGRTEEKDTAERIFDAFLNPANDSKIVETEADKEIKRLNLIQDESVSPNTPAKKITYTSIGGTVYTDRRLTADEYVSLAKLQGQTQKQLVEDLIGNSAYGALSDEDKAQAIRYAYDYAQQSARGDVIKGHPGITTKWMKELKGDIAEGILRHITADGKYAALSVSDAAYIDDLLDGLTAEKGRSNVRPIQQIEAIADSKLSEADQKKVLEETLNESAYDKFMAVLKLGMDTDDYAASYRLYLDAESGSGKKARIIKSFQNELDVTYSVAVKLYNIYAGKK